MFTTGLMIITYVAIATLAALMTYCEQRRDQNRSTVYNLLGFLACAVWPLTLGLAFAAAWMPAKGVFQAPTGA